MTLLDFGDNMKREYEIVTFPEVAFRQTSDEIIRHFLKDHPDFSKVEWLKKEKELTLWFMGNCEPFSKDEFVRYTHTWNMLDDLEKKLLASN